MSELPKGKLCGMDVGRLMLGGNMLSHCTHGRDQAYLPNLIAAYNTPEKLLETFAKAEDCGIDTLSVHTVPWLIELFVEHRRRGGKMKWIINPTADWQQEGLADYKDQVQWLIDQGSESLYVWGVHGDWVIQENRPELIGEMVEIIKSHNVPCGVGGHNLDVIRYSEANGVRADFYLKTRHHHDYPTAPKPEDLVWPLSEVPPYFDKHPVETAEFMATVEKPWIAFKTMASGSILPESAFEYVLNNGADFVLAGMFDYEIAHNVEVTKNLLASDLPKRTRPWRA